MATLSSFLEGVRYDTTDYETGLEFDDRELVNYLNRMIVLVDSTLNSINSDLLLGVEKNTNIVAYQDYVNITNINNGWWDSVTQVWLGANQLTHITLSEMRIKKQSTIGGTLIEDDTTVVNTVYEIVTQTTTDMETGGAADNNIGTIFNCDTAITLGEDDVLQIINTGTPIYWALDSNHIIFDTHIGSGVTTTNLVIFYRKKTRPRLQTWSDTFTAATTDLCTVSPAHTFPTGAGRFQVSTVTTLPAGLSATTDYWIEFVSPTTFYLCSSKSNAMGSSNVNITDAGTGTHTITLTEYMPFDSRWDNLFREMLVLHAKAKKEGQMNTPDQIFQEVFRKRAFEEHIRRNFVPNSYYIDF